MEQIKILEIINRGGYLNTEQITTVKQKYTYNKKCNGGSYTKKIITCRPTNQKKHLHAFKSREPKTWQKKAKA